MLKTKTITLSIVLILGLFTGLVCFAEDRASRIHHKADLVQHTAEQWAQQGKNPAQAVELMKQASAAFERGNADQGEAHLDQAMQALDLTGTSAQPTDKHALSSHEPTSNLYANPERVDIIGYTEDSMEPCISPDGQYMFFNGSNADDIDVHISLAKRISDTRFQYLGLLPGVQSAHRDMAPSLDRYNNIYFTTLRSIAEDGKSLYVGKWHQLNVSAPRTVDGDISPPRPGTPSIWVNMDCGISPDGCTLFISRAQIMRGEPGPRQSDLLLANREANGHFNISPQSAQLLKRVNTRALEYAPCVSADGLELYFTRAMAPDQIDTRPDSPLVQIMVAKRSSIDKPFGEPERLVALDGFVEAPSTTLDKGEMFYHKKDGKFFHIYRAKRSAIKMTSL